ncbi:hypothetical protein R1sor_020090 [Riccia sorocarpa]|uniref:Rubredoxin-like domain-containing protein n=1 Tax=Riccia sorocarpa TaxID=122646 RepID=A0ABD3IEC4_9MARC
MATATALGLGVTGALRTAVASLNQSHKSRSNSITELPRSHQRVRFNNVRRDGLKSGSCRCSRFVYMSVNVNDNATEAEEPSVKPAEAESGEPERPNPRQGLEERFVVKDLGKYECRSCGYVYDTTKGDSNYPVPAGIEFSGLPEDWRCPTCGAAKTFFVSKSVEIAGFAQNQQFGLGGNSLTEGQKSLLIYGTLGFFFALFLAGYLLS